VVERADTTTNTAYTLEDKEGCTGSSSAKIYTVNRLGYASPVEVLWP
jgi:hypothetical protein